jgi:hypothetical protein
MLMTLSFRFLLILRAERARLVSWGVATNPAGWAFESGNALGWIVSRRVCAQLHRLLLQKMRKTYATVYPLQDKVSVKEHPSLVFFVDLIGLFFPLKSGMLSSVSWQSPAVGMSWV